MRRTGNLTDLPCPEPRNLASLKQEVGTRWSMTSLLDMLKETAIK